LRLPTTAVNTSLFSGSKMEIPAKAIDLRMTYVPQRYSTSFQAAWLGVLLLAGCSTAAPSERVPTAEPQVSTSFNETKKLEQPPSAAQDVARGNDNALILENLWRSRTNAASHKKSSDFSLGPGDVLRISLPQLDGQKDRTVRVTEENTIALPLLGVIDVSGMTEANLRDELIRREEKYVYTPQVEVFLEHSESRDVAVLGSVKVPGRYMLASRDDTILTMIGRAGGLTEDAASRIILVPTPLTQEVGGGPRLVATATLMSPDSPQDNVSTTRQALSDQVVIELSRADNQYYLQLPARSGDVIIVPSAGEVTVEGWVPNPGKFKITQGMTALSAIAAAGGPQFSGSATLLREQKTGGKLDISLNLSKVKKGSEPDVPLQGGDVVIVERSLLGAVPYSLYFIISHVGVGIPLF
jgi:polysaccharide export outer membrane protein